MVTQSLRGKMQNYFNQVMASAYLNVSPRTMERWRYEGVGPAFIRVGGSDKGKVLYSEEDLNNYLQLNTKKLNQKCPRQ